MNRQESVNSLASRSPWPLPTVFRARLTPRVYVARHRSARSARRAASMHPAAPRRRRLVTASGSDSAQAGRHTDQGRPRARPKVRRPHGGQRAPSILAARPKRTPAAQAPRPTDRDPIDMASLSGRTTNQLLELGLRRIGDQRPRCRGVGDTDWLQTQAPCWEACTSVARTTSEERSTARGTSYALVTTTDATSPTSSPGRTTGLRPVTAHSRVTLPQSIGRGGARLKPPLGCHKPACPFGGPTVPLRGPTVPLRGANRTPSRA